MELVYDILVGKEVIESTAIFYGEQNIIENDYIHRLVETAAGSRFCLEYETAAWRLRRNASPTKHTAIIANWKELRHSFSGEDLQIVTDKSAFRNYLSTLTYAEEYYFISRKLKKIHDSIGSGRK